MKKSVIVASITIITVSLILSCSMSGLPGQSLFEKGVKNLKKGDFEEARKNFEEAQQKYPDSPYGPYSMAYFYDYEELTYEAIKSCQESLELDDKFLPGLDLLSRLLLKIDRPELAFYVNGLYAENGGDLIEGTVFESEILLSAGKVSDATKSLKDIKADQATPELMIANAVLDLHRGDIPGAMALINNVVDRSHDSSKLLNRIGKFFMMIGQYDSSYTYFKQAVDVDPDDYMVKKDVIESLVEMRYLDQANEYLDEYVSVTGQNHWSYLMKSRIYLKQDKVKKAEEAYGMALPLYPTTPTSMGIFARIQMKSNNDMKAAYYYETAAELTESNNYPNSAKISFLLDEVDMLIDANLLDRAGNAVDMVLDSLPNDFRALYDISTLFYRFDRKDSLKVYLDKTEGAAQGYYTNMAKLARLFATVGEYDRAANTVDKVLKEDKLNIDAYLAGMEVYENQGELDKAIEFIDQYDDYVSYIPAIGFKKLDLMVSAGNFESAEEFINRLIEAAPNDIERYHLAAGIADKAGQHEKVFDIYTDAVAKNPDSPDLDFYLAKEYYDRGEKTNVEPLLDKALAIDSNHVESLVLKAYLISDRGDHAKAIELLKRAVKIDQYYGRAQGKLAVLILKYTDEPPTNGLSMANRAKQNDATDANAFFAIGLANYKMEKYKLGTVAFDEAVKLVPDNAEYHYYAGMNLIKLGQTSNGKKLLNKALKLGLPDDLKKEAEAVL